MLSVERYTRPERLEAMSMQLGLVIGFDLVQPTKTQALAVEGALAATFDDFHPGYDARAGLAYHF